LNWESVLPDKKQGGYQVSKGRIPAFGGDRAFRSNLLANRQKDFRFNPLRGPGVKTCTPKAEIRSGIFSGSS
jgi:hypothetical protein